mmetsp:Transcript_59808/g.168557  ORF Transcript_59808/g.168557 Transcript_59808/m.168557 type:complete len:331 (+) Transcript_59808:187-1179(+)
MRSCQSLQLTSYTYGTTTIRQGAQEQTQGFQSRQSDTASSIGSSFFGCDAADIHMFVIVGLRCGRLFLADSSRPFVAPEGTRTSHFRNCSMSSTSCICRRSCHSPAIVAASACQSPCAPPGPASLKRSMALARSSSPDGILTNFSVRPMHHTMYPNSSKSRLRSVEWSASPKSASFACRQPSLGTARSRTFSGLMSLWVRLLVCMNSRAEAICLVTAPMHCRVRRSLSIRFWSVPRSMYSITRQQKLPGNFFGRLPVSVPSAKALFSRPESASSASLWTTASTYCTMWGCTPTQEPCAHSLSATETHRSLCSFSTTVSPDALVLHVSTYP